jgi:hypothetical protein
VECADACGEQLTRPQCVRGCGSCASLRAPKHARCQVHVHNPPGTGLPSAALWQLPRIMQGVGAADGGAQRTRV